MSEHGAALQTYNQELVKCVEDLKIRRHELLDVISKEEAEKVVLEKNIALLNEKLGLLDNNLQQHRLMCENYERTIRETENGFKKILESSQALLHLAQHEANQIDSNASKNERYSYSDNNYRIG